jgi:transposase
MASQGKVGYPSDVSDEEWAFVLPYLLLSREDSAHREHDLRAVFNGVRYIARTGNQWRFMPHDYPPWPAIFQQMQRWMRAGCFERLVEDTRILLREFAGRKGSKVHIAVDTLGHLLSLSVTPADQGDRTQVEALAQDMQQVTGGTVEMAYVDQGYTGPNAAEAAQSHGIRLEVVKHPLAKAASCCCRAAGWSNEASPGPLDSADSCATTNGSTPPSKDFITSPSPAS